MGMGGHTWTVQTDEPFRNAQMDAELDGWCRET